MGSSRVENEQIKKPLLDDRKYLVIVLENGLEALLITDPEADKAAASLDVLVGYGKDPEIAGLAHFLEHMLFLGTEKYPDENSTSEFLAAHGGGSNAYTTSEHTNYHFEVLSSYLEESLDRFAQFFVAPLFNESAVDREMNAVDSEHKKNLQSDANRFYQLMKSTSNPKHSFHKFGTGNLTTIKDIPEAAGKNVRAELIDFHEKQYRASLMKLAVIGKEDLATLETWVRRMFDPIKNVIHEDPSSGNAIFPYEAAQLQHRYYVVPVKDIHKLYIQFPMPSFDAEYVKAPLKPLSHLLGHESAGSILSLLKKNGWGDSLISGISTQNTDFCIFKVEVGLTEKGINFVDEIVKIVFQYLALMKSSGIQKWIYDEIHSVDSMHFIFLHKKNPLSYVRELSADMHLYAPEHILAGGYLCEEFDPELIRRCLDYLNPDNMNLYILSRTVAASTDKKEDWYGTDYKVEDFSPEFSHQLKNIPLNADLFLPAVNEFIPTEFALREYKETDPKYQVPAIAWKSQMSTVWHKQDSKFKLPRTFAAVSMITPIVNSDAKNYVKAYLLGDLISDSLNEYSYYAEISGLSFRIEVTTKGLVMLVRGFSQKLPVLFQRVLEKIKGFAVDQDRFVLFKQQMTRSYANFRFDSPFKHTQYSFQHLLRARRWTYEEKEAALGVITFEELQHFASELFSKLAFESFFYGNIEKTEAVALAEMVEKILAPIPLPDTEFPEERILRLPTGSDFHYSCELFNPNDQNSAIYNFYQVGVENTREDVLMDLFNSINETIFYDELRTKQQLGYIVWSGPRSQSGVQGFRVEIQSPTYSPIVMDQRIEECLKGIQTTLEQLEEKEFQRRVNILIERKLQKDKKLEEEFQRFWEELNLHHYQFYRAETEVAMLKTLTKADLIAFYEKYLLKNETRSKMSLQHVSKPKWEEYRVEASSVPAEKVITDVTNFKHQCYMFPTHTALDISLLEKLKAEAKST